MHALDALAELGIDRVWADGQLDAWAERDDAGDFAVARDMADALTRYEPGAAQ